MYTKICDTISAINSVNYSAAPEECTMTLGDLDNVCILGTGTFGKVYLCKYTKLNRFLALKVLKKNDMIIHNQIEHINAERKILSIISHPFIVKMLASFQDKEKLYIVFEYIAGGELFTHLRKATKFCLETVKFYAAEIVLALEYLHSKDIIYRDLKPENILLDNSGHIKITDFGFAKSVTEKTFTLCGTSEYLAPEIVQSKGHGKEADWWALGILIYEMLSGAPPFFADNQYDIYQKILECKLVFPNYFDNYSRDIIKQFLTINKHHRLGSSQKGIEEIKRHPFFKDIDWEALLQRRVMPPIVPIIKSDRDTPYFSDFIEEEDHEEDSDSESLQPYDSVFDDLFEGF